MLGIEYIYKFNDNVKKNELKKMLSYLENIYGDTIDNIYKNLLHINKWRIKKGFITELEFYKIKDFYTIEKFCKNEKYDIFDINIKGKRKISNDEFNKFISYYEHQKSNISKNMYIEHSLINVNIGKDFGNFNYLINREKNGNKNKIFSRTWGKYINQ